MRDPKIDPAVGDELEDVFHLVTVRRVADLGTSHATVDLWQIKRDFITGKNTGEALTNLTMSDFARVVRNMRVKYAVPKIR